MKQINRLIYYFLCLYIIIIPLVPISSGIKFVNLIPDTLLTLIVLIFTIKVISNKTERNNFIRNFKNCVKDNFSKFLLALSVIMVISISYSFDRKIAINETLRFISYIALYFIIKYSINEKGYIRGLLKSFIAIVAIVSIYGLIQFFMVYGFNNIYYYIYAIKVIPFPRIAASLDNPNNLGAFLVLGFFPIVMLTIREKKSIRKILYCLLSLLIIFDIFMTFSRNALIGIAIGSLVLVVIYSCKILLIFGGVGIIAISIPQIISRLKSVINVSANLDRVYLWETAIKMIKDHPVFGVGNGNFISLNASYVKKYPELKYAGINHFPSHNSYLKVESELGIIGIVSFLGILICSLFKITKIIKLYDNTFYSFFYKGFFASCIAFFFMNISDNLFFIPKTITYFWILLGIADCLIFQKEHNIKSGLFNKSN